MCKEFGKFPIVNLPDIVKLPNITLHVFHCLLFPFINRSDRWINRISKVMFVVMYKLGWFNFRDMTKTPSDDEAETKKPSKQIQHLLESLDKPTAEPL